MLKLNIDMMLKERQIIHGLIDRQFLLISSEVERTDEGNSVFAWSAYTLNPALSYSVFTYIEGELFIGASISFGLMPDSENTKASHTLLEVNSGLRSGLLYSTTLHSLVSVGFHLSAKEFQMDQLESLFTQLIETAIASVDKYVNEDTGIRPLNMFSPNPKKRHGK